MIERLLAVSLLLALALGACTSDEEEDSARDLGPRPADQGAGGGDLAALPDQGTAPPQDLAPPQDTGGAPDLSVAPDTGAATDLAGLDQGHPGLDLGMAGDLGATQDLAPGADATTAVDQGTAPDCAPTPGNLLDNGGFETWEGGLPSGWGGPETDLSSDNVARAAQPRCGEAALELANEGERHRRFTVGPMALPAGRYLCSYWVRGEGDIRNAYYDGEGYSSYRPSGYRSIRSAEWQEQTYEFSLAAPVAAGFELVFSLRLTNPDAGHLQLDDVVLLRQPDPCDALDCGEWGRCDAQTLSCVPLAGHCIEDADCLEWEECDLDHACVLRPGRCRQMADCPVDSATPVCDTAEHRCVAGDPCDGVDCPEWRRCDPDTARCVLGPERCDTTDDCLGALPACDGAAHTCVPASDAVNLVPNGGFEDWEVQGIPYEGDHLLPTFWYGLDIPGSSEIDPAQVQPVEEGAHGGLRACAIDQPGVAERFTSEAFDVPAGNWTCAYWVRGHGGIRHRTYSTGGWSPETDRIDLDTSEWQRVPFDIRSNVRDLRIIFYASFTQADRGHIQLDDVVCTRDAAR